MSIKITVTGNKYPTGKSTTTFGKGGVLIHEGLLLRIQDTIKSPSSPAYAKVVKVMETSARAKIKDTRQAAINHFSKTMEAVTKLAQNSTVRAISGGLGETYTEKGANYSRTVRPAILLADRKSITAHISAPEVGVNVTQSWKTLNHYYFHRTPQSKMFFTKRKGSEGRKIGGSSRLKMLRDLKTFKSSITASSNIGLNPLKGTPSSVSGKQSLTLKFSYTLAFPSLHKFDFIRKAYVHTAQGAIDRFPSMSIEVDGKNVKVFDKNYGILYAERLRPFFRVLAAEAGKDLRKKLTQPLNLNKGK